MIKLDINLVFELEKYAQKYEKYAFLTAALAKKTLTEENLRTSSSSDPAIQEPLPQRLFASTDYTIQMGKKHLRASKFEF